MSSELILNIVLMLLTMLLSLTVHEYAHAAAARYLGDDTAEQMGRLTLNPIAHIDPIGTIGIPVFLALSGASFGFGWAKPVPFNPTRFRRTVTMRAGTMIVAAAGPVSNLILATLVTAAMAIVVHVPIGIPDAIWALLVTMLKLNVALALFNLIPVGPLDGRKVLTGLLAPSTSMRFERFNERYSIVLLGIVVMFGWQVIEVPLRLIIGLLLAVFGIAH